MIGHSSNGLDSIGGLDDVVLTKSDLVSLRKNVFQIDPNLSHRYKVAYGNALREAEQEARDFEDACVDAKRGLKRFDNRNQPTVDLDRIKNSYPQHSSSFDIWLIHMFYRMIITPEGEINPLERTDQLFWGYFADQILLREEADSQDVLRDLFNEATLVDGSTILNPNTQTGEFKEDKLSNVRWISTYPKLFIERGAYNVLHESESLWPQFMNVVERPIVILGA